MNSTATRPQARVASCPECGLQLPDEPDQRDKRCPDCLREHGTAVLMKSAPDEVEA
jgi:hypothetical protein